MKDEENREDADSLLAVLGEAVAYIANESLILAQYEMVQEEVFSFRWPWPENDKDAFIKQMNAVTEHLGGPPELILLFDDEEPPTADNYPIAVLNEVISVFHRARKSVLRAHMFMTGISMLDDSVGVFSLSDDAEESAMLVRQANIAFWEHAEAAFIRLYSFWDRVGQVLDFAFFNIRKFDQNGFTAVMNRIHANAAPMDERFRVNSSWKRLRSFQTSEKEDGLKWLLQRRNLIIHSLHLHPVEVNEEGVFKSQFNHLDMAHKEKLRPRDPSQEVSLLLGQLNRVSELFPDFLNVIELSPARKSAY